MNTGQALVIDVGNIPELPLGPAQQIISKAMVLPVTSRGDDRPLGVLIAGVNPTRKLDSEYRTFYELIAGQVATAIANVRAAEEDRKRAEAFAELTGRRPSSLAMSATRSHSFTLMFGPVEDLLSRSYTGLSPSAKTNWNW